MKRVDIAVLRGRVPGSFQARRTVLQCDPATLIDHVGLYAEFDFGCMYQPCPCPSPALAQKQISP